MSEKVILTINSVSVEMPMWARVSIQDKTFWDPEARKPVKAGTVTIDASHLEFYRDEDPKDLH